MKSKKFLLFIHDSSVALQMVTYLYKFNLRNKNYKLVIFTENEKNKSNLKNDINIIFKNFNFKIIDLKIKNFNLFTLNNIFYWKKILLINKLNFLYLKNILIKKKINLNIWGTGKVLREIIYVDDVADACIHFMRIKSKRSLINIGTGKDLTINQYANKILKVLKVKAKIKHDKSKPDGTPKKLLDISIAKKYGWKPRVSIEMGISMAYNSFLKTK